MGGAITKDLIACLNGEDVDTSKFFSIHPQTDSLKKDIYELVKKGYVTIDEGDDKILLISATQKLIDLAMAMK